MNFRGPIFSAVYHPQGVLHKKVSSALAHWEHGECDGIATESTESRWNRDGFPTDFFSGFRQGDIPLQFRHDSVDSMDFPWIQQIFEIKYLSLNNHYNGYFKIKGQMFIQNSILILK